MRKKEKMSVDTVKRKLDKKIENGSPVCAMMVIRLSKGLTQVELAEKAGMKQGYISRIESGARDMSKVTMENGYRIAEALGCRMEDLLK